MTVCMTIRKEPLSLDARGFRSVIRRAFRTALAAEGVDVPCQIDVLITDDEGIRRINREHRSLDRATDVLSFPMQQLALSHRI